MRSKLVQSVFHSRDVYVAGEDPFAFRTSMNNVRNEGPCLATLATFGRRSNPRRQIDSLRRGEMVVRNVSIVANR